MADKKNMREEALQALMTMEKTDRLSHLVIGEALMRLQFMPKNERAFFTMLCEGVTEQKIYLDYVLDAYSRTKMRKCKPLIRNLLRLSAYQILFMHVPDAAACNEAVSLAKKRGFRSLSGFVNGVLRTLSREKEHLPLPDAEKEPFTWLSVRYSMPEWLVRLLVEQYGRETTERMLQAFLATRPTTIRTCTDRITPEQLKKRLEESGVTAREGICLPYALQISGYNYLNKIPAFREGLFVVQDESSMFPVEVSGIKAVDRVLDLCAAPGGKTFHAAERVGSEGQVIARDLTEYKTEILQENNERMKYSQIKIEQWDATEFDPALESAVDVVLCDLPCSGLGIMGRKNDIKYHLTEKQLDELVRLQRSILAVAWRYVKPGGILVFSTCTLNQRENVENVRWIEENTPLRRVSMEDRLPQTFRGRTGEEGYLQLLPGIDGCDGFFVAKFTR